MRPIDWNQSWILYLFKILGSNKRTFHVLNVKAYSLICALELALLDRCSDIKVQHPGNHCARQSCQYRSTFSPWRNPRSRLAYRLYCSHIVHSDMELALFPCDSRNPGEECLRTPFQVKSLGRTIQKRDFFFFFLSLRWSALKSRVGVLFVLPRSIPTTAILTGNEFSLSSSRSSKALESQIPRRWCENRNRADVETFCG